MTELLMYDVETDIERPVSQHDIDDYCRLVHAVGLQSPEIQEAIRSTCRELLEKEHQRQEDAAMAVLGAIKLKYERKFANENL